MGTNNVQGPYGLGNVRGLMAMGVQPPDPTFMDQFQQNKMGNPDDLYAQYMKSILLPPSNPSGQLPPAQRGMMASFRNIFPLVDSAQGHQDLQSTLNNYPFTPEAKKLLSQTLIRSSMVPDVVEEEADTSPETYLGFSTGRDKMRIAEGKFVSPPASVPEHELMHAYLDAKGYPYGESAFNQDWETAKNTTPLLKNIDQFLATSPDYTDEQNRTDLTQERFAYLAQAKAGGGLKAFPQQLQRHYQGIFR